MRKYWELLFLILRITHGLHQGVIPGARRADGDGELYRLNLSSAISSSWERHFTRWWSSNLHEGSRTGCDVRVSGDMTTSADDVSEWRARNSKSPHFLLGQRALSQLNLETVFPVGFIFICKLENLLVTNSHVHDVFPKLFFLFFQNTKSRKSSMDIGWTLFRLKVTQ